MRGFKAAELNRKICLGQGARFGGVPCDHYDKGSGECRLLREGRMKELYELGRCLSLEVVIRKVDQIHQKFFRSPVVYEKTRSGSLIGNGDDEREGSEVRSEERDRGDSNTGKGYSECEDIEIERIIRGVLEARLQGHTLTDLYNYIGRAIRNQMGERLRARGIPFRKAYCGTCEYLPESRPRICQLERLKDTRPSSQTPNQFFGKERKWDDPSCSGHERKSPRIESYDDEVGAGSSAIVSGQTRRDSTWGEETDARLDIGHLFSMLQNCFEEANTEKQKEIYAVILEDIGYIYEHLRDGCSLEDARSRLLELKTTNRRKRDNYAKMLGRNLKRLEECLGQKKMSE